MIWVPPKKFKNMLVSYTPHPFFSPQMLCLSKIIDGKETEYVQVK